VLPLRSSLRVALAVLLVAAGLAACAPRAGTAQQAESPAPLPSATGPYAETLRYGRELMQRTPAMLPRNVGAAMSCENCHIDAGTREHVLALTGTYAAFPLWNPRAKRIIAVQDRIAECFLYSVNGTPPAYTSRAMEALTTYIAWLSRGTPVGERPPGQAPPAFDSPHPPDSAAGAQVYAQRCVACHGADGGGKPGTFPPLWGPHSFNDGAGMDNANMMARFVRYAMPFGSPPNTLTAQEAYDVTAFVLKHPRPHFDPHRAIGFPPRQSSFF
jgi:thiosulfate dehydrogenase